MDEALWCYKCLDGWTDGWVTLRPTSNDANKVKPESLVINGGLVIVNMETACNKVSSHLQLHVMTNTREKWMFFRCNIVNVNVQTINILQLAAWLKKMLCQPGRR